MMGSDRKYINPKSLADSIVNNNGIPIKIGEEKDVGEFNINFLARVDEAVSNQTNPAKRSSLEPHMFSASRAAHQPLVFQSESFISKSFFGKLLIRTHAIDSKNQPIEMNEETTFGQIMINPTAKNIYQGWEDNYFSDIDDFLTYENLRTRAQQEFWIKEAPNVLFLQMQRVVYDKNEKILKKITNPIEFDKIIYIDRFLECNRAKATEARAMLSSLKDEIAMKEEILKKYTEYGKNKQNLLDMLEGTIEFLDFQGPNFASAPEHFKNVNKSNVESSKKLIREYIKEINLKKNQLNAEINELKSKINKAYETWNENPYELHSIWIHSGVPESGHYYAYVYSKKENKWRQYNDRIVKDEDEKKIFPINHDTTFDPILSQAYCLIYIKHDINSSNWKSPKDYSKLLNKQLQLIIKNDNAQLKTEIEFYKVRKIAESINQEYNSRVVILQGFLKKPSYESFNFISYLYSIRDELWKWKLLDEISKDFKYDGLDSLYNNKTVIEELNKFLIVSKAPIKIMPLNVNEKNALKVAKENYKIIFLDWFLKRHILERIIEDDWEKAINVISFYLAQGKYNSKRDYEIVIDILKVLTLRLMTHINEKIIQSDISGAIKFVKLVSIICITYFPKDDNHSKLIIEVLTSVFNNVKNIINEKEYNVVQEHIKDIKDFTMLLENPIPMEFPAVYYI